MIWQVSLFILTDSRVQGSIGVYTTFQLSTLIALVQMRWGFKCPLKFFCVNRRQQLTARNQTAMFRKQHLMRLQKLVSAHRTLSVSELCSLAAFHLSPGNPTGDLLHMCDRGHHSLGGGQLWLSSYRQEVQDLRLKPQFFDFIYA